MRSHRSVVLAVTLLSATALADAPQETQALSFLRAGKNLYSAGDYEAALYPLRKARDLAPHKPAPYQWLALVEAKVGHCAEAIRNVDEFLARVAPDDERRAEAQQVRDECEKKLAAAPSAPRPIAAPTSPAAAHPSPPVIARPEPLAPASPPRASSQRRWLWAAIGGATVVVGGAAIAIGLGTMERDPSSNYQITVP